jgi:hypothetical protein
VPGSRCPAAFCTSSSWAVPFANTVPSIWDCPSPRQTRLRREPCRRSRTRGYGPSTRRSAGAGTGVRGCPAFRPATGAQSMAQRHRGEEKEQRRVLGRINADAALHAGLGPAPNAKPRVILFAVSGEFCSSRQSRRNRPADCRTPSTQAAGASPGRTARSRSARPSPPVRARLMLNHGTTRSGGRKQRRRHPMLLAGL